jgi:hypothetical protein
LTIPTTIQNMIPGIISNMIPSMSSSNVVFVFVWTLGDPWICSLIANSMLTSISKRFSNLFNKKQKWKCVSRFILNVFPNKIKNGSGNMFTTISNMGAPLISDNVV